MKGLLKAASDVHVLHSTATLKSLLNRQRISGHCEDVREMMEAQRQVTNQEL